MKRIPLQTRIGAVLRAHREELEISQEDFAELVQMHRTYYSAIERALLGSSQQSGGDTTDGRTGIDIPDHTRSGTDDRAISDD